MSDVKGAVPPERSAWRASGVRLGRFAGDRGRQSARLTGVESDGLMGVNEPIHDLLAQAENLFEHHFIHCEEAFCDCLDFDPM